MNKCIHIKLIWKVLKSFSNFTIIYSCVVSIFNNEKYTFRFSLKVKSLW